MALQLPNIYTLGQVKVDTSGLAALQGKLLAQKQAKEEALDKYYNDLNSKVTPAGMHSKDIPGFLEKKKELSDYWIKNKNEISKGGLAKQEFDSKYSKLLGDVEQSKSDVKFLYDMRDKDIEEEDLPKLAARGRSIYDPSYYKDPNTKTPYDYSDFSHFVKLPETSQINQYYNSLTEGLTPKRVYQKDEKGNYIEIPVGGGSFDVKRKYLEEYDNEQLNEQARRAAFFTKNNEGLRKLYKTYLNDAAKAAKQNLPPSPEFTELADIFSKRFPGDTMDTPEDVAKADAILRALKSRKEGEEKIPGTKREIEYRARFKEGDGKDAEEVDLSQYDILGQITEAKGVKDRGIFKGLFGGKPRTLVFKKDIDPKDYEFIIGKDVDPLITDDGREYFEVDPNTGDWIGENATISAASAARRNLDRTTLSEEKRGATKLKPYTPVPSKSVPSGKTYNVGGKTFSLDQMSKWAKKYNMSLDKYLEKVGAK